MSREEVIKWLHTLALRADVDMEQRALTEAARLIEEAA